MIAPVGQTFLKHQNVRIPDDSVNIYPPFGKTVVLDVNTLEIFTQTKFKELISEELTRHNHYYLAVAIDENTRVFFADACSFIRSLDPRFATGTNPTTRALYKDYRIYKSRVNKLTGEFSFKLMCEGDQLSRSTFFQHRIRAHDKTALVEERINSFRILAERDTIKQKTFVIPKLGESPLKSLLYCLEQAAVLGDIYAATKIGNEMLALYKEQAKDLFYATAFNFYSFALELATGIKNSDAKSEIDVSTRTYQAALKILSAVDTEPKILEKTHLAFKGLELCLLTPAKDSSYLKVSEKISLFIVVFTPLLQLQSKVALCTNLENAVETSRSFSSESLSSSEDSGILDDPFDDAGIDSYFYENNLIKADK